MKKYMIGLMAVIFLNSCASKSTNSDDYINFLINNEFSIVDYMQDFGDNKVIIVNNEIKEGFFDINKVNSSIFKYEIINNTQLVSRNNGNLVETYDINFNALKKSWDNNKDSLGIINLGKNSNLMVNLEKKELIVTLKSVKDDNKIVGKLLLKVKS